MPLFTILTLFPEAVESYLAVGVLGIAVRKGTIRVQAIDLRDFTRDRHRTTDDRPYGGGPGMVLRPEPIAEAVEWVEREHGPHRRLVMDPAGRPFQQGDARALAAEQRTLLLAGRYEGIDARVLEQFEFEPVTLGDFVLAGGELPALCMLEAAARLIPGVLGDERSAVEDSFTEASTLDHPHYTRPRVFRGDGVPEVLMSGDHAAIECWREDQARARARRWRPDLARREGEGGGA
ncbi:MAG: tRNA (guanosine(37)-N1)-methyltransferase TrmD [Planctomycetes bacterium]|nr:tRNA (guanosine(37)-N1)-methyltransferase TrmD [Planctomycetota bacterium]